MRLESDQILWLLGSLCGIKRVPFDARLVLQNFPPPHSEATLMEAARAFGFRLGAAKLDRAMLEKLSGACIAFFRPDVPGGQGRTAQGDSADSQYSSSDGGGQQAAGEAPPRLALILRSDDERVLYFEQGSNRPQSISLGLATMIFKSVCYLIFVKEETSSKADAMNSPSSRIGFRWLSANLLKRKSVWRRFSVPTEANARKRILDPAPVGMMQKWPILGKEK